jgi:hypothetical protein
MFFNRNQRKVARGKRLGRLRIWDCVLRIGKKATSYVFALSDNALSPSSLLLFPFAVSTANPQSTIGNLRASHSGEHACRQ